MADTPVNESQANYYFDLTPDAQDIDNVLIDLVAALKNTGENKVVIRKKASESQDNKPHFILGEGGTDFKIQANHFEIIIGDGNNGAYGGSQDSAQNSSGSLYAENLYTYDGSDTSSVNTHYIYGLRPNTTSPTSYERYIVGAKYTTSSGKKSLPGGCFMMVDNGGRLIAKDGAYIHAYHGGYIRVDHSAAVTFDNSSKCHIEDNSELTMHGGYIHINHNSGIHTTGYAQLYMNSYAILGMEDSAKAYLEGSSTLYMFNNALASLTGNARLHMNGWGKWCPELQINGNAKFIMNGQEGEADASPWGPCFIIDTDGRCFTSKSEGCMGKHTLSSQFGNLKYLLGKVWEEYSANGVITPRTLNFLYKNSYEGEWHKLLNSEAEQITLDSLVYTITSIDDTKKASLNTIIEAYNQKKGTSITKDLIYNCCAISRREKYNEIINFPITVKNFLTEGNYFDSSKNAYKTLNDSDKDDWRDPLYYTDFKAALSDASIDYDTYFFDAYEKFNPGSQYGFTLLKTIIDSYKEDNPSYSYTVQSFTPSVQYYLSCNDVNLRNAMAAINEGVDNTDAYVLNYATKVQQDDTIYQLKDTFNNIKTQLLRAGTKIEYYIDLNTNTIKNVTAYENLKDNLIPQTSEKISNNSTVIINGHDFGYTYIQAASNEYKKVDIRFLDGSSVEFNGDARLVLTSKDLYLDGIDTNPVRYSPGLTISFDREAQSHSKPTDSPDEIHFSPSEIYALKQIVQNYLNSQT